MVFPFAKYPRPLFNVGIKQNNLYAQKHLSFVQHWSRGGGRRRKEVKGSSLPNTFDHDNYIPFIAAPSPRQSLPDFVREEEAAVYKLCKNSR